MTDKKTLTVADFKDAIVYECGLENRDPQRGYRRETPVRETELFRMLENNTETQMYSAQAAQEQRDKLDKVR